MEQEISEIKLDSSEAAKPIRNVEQSPKGGFSGGGNGSSGINRRKIGIILGGILLVLFILGVVVGFPLFRAYQDGKRTYALALGVKNAVKSQDIKKTTEAIAATKEQLKKVQGDLKLISWVRFVPFLGGYVSDAIHLANAGESGLDAALILTQATEPYADILGLKGQGTFTGGTTEERIATVVKTLDKVVPEVDKVAIRLAVVQKEVDQVDPNRYPETFQGRPVKESLAQLKAVVDTAGSILTEARPMVKKLPQLLGANGSAKYLILFQNDKELRPTGGFITAYAIFRVENGKIHLESSDDIYKLDDTLTLHVAPPDPISKYLNVYGWRMRDANFSPDFYSSMRTFEDLYQHSTAKQETLGILAVDTDVLIRMMEVLGPISIYGTNFTTQKVPQCDCPMVIYELEKYADEPKSYERGSRKDMIGVLLSELLRKAMTSPKQVYGPLFQAMIDESRQKHILFFLHDADAQKGIEALGWGGRIKTYDGDYLHVNDANLAGAKSNLFIIPTASQEVTVTDRGAEEKLTLEYRYPHPADNCSLERKEGLCLAGIYRDYVRVYLPAGAEVTNTRGFESKSQTFSDLGHVVVDGYFTVVPQGLAKVEVTYKITGDFKKRGVYQSLIQKQPGTVGNKYRVTVNGKVQEFTLTEDREIVVKL